LVNRLTIHNNMAQDDKKLNNSEASKMYLNCKRIKEELEKRIRENPSKKTETGLFRFGPQSTAISIFTISDMELLIAIKLYLDFKRGNLAYSSGETGEKVDTHQNIKITDWLEDIEDRLDRLEAPEKIKRAKQCMDKLLPILSDKDNFELLKKEFSEFS
jgi:hypothetical protein